MVKDVIFVAFNAEMLNAEEECVPQTHTIGWARRGQTERKGSLLNKKKDMLNLID